ncbi:hypothetical protein OGAPHI_001677 [Ogataea philodendri]|uniref:t-SNARE coiled-coil homology domain-containing protein n=1 Tax=Ogataea philodendri TaxID=1378263 RepID=A0A9P8T8K2_9ASCO|nr:uncharacterized protein OGAPHI_001677 [Ogataea philodendri]KAH3669081.1 hypothetical protein OGAPHI_001677 [Ogataea philodendri]
MSSPFDAITLEEQPVYQDVPEFDEINQQISNALLSVNNSLSNLNKNLNFLETAIDKGQSVEKYQQSSSKLISQLMDLFKGVSSDTRTLNGLDAALLNKSQTFVRDKLNTNLKRSLQEFNQLQQFYTDLEKKQNEKSASLIGSGLVDETPVAQPQQQQVVIEYEPVNAEEVEYQRALIEERERDIENISHGIEELNEIFHDLSNIVVDQGSMIDNIESNFRPSEPQLATSPFEFQATPYTGIVCTFGSVASSTHSSSDLSVDGSVAPVPVWVSGLVFFHILTNESSLQLTNRRLSLFSQSAHQIVPWVPWQLATHTHSSSS